MNRKILLFPLVFAAGISLQAQQDPYYTHFAFNRVFYNPAYAGATGGICANMINHKQWLMLPEQTGLFRTEGGLAPISPIPGAIGPITNGLGISAPIQFSKFGNYGGVSAATISDNIAYENNTYFKFGLAGAIPIGMDGEFRAGVDFTNQTKRWDAGKLRAMHMDDPMLPINPNPSSSKWLLGAGLYARFGGSRNLQLGASMTNINKARFEYFNKGGSQTFVEAARHLYLFASWEYKDFMGNPNLKLQPNLFVRSVKGANGWIKPQAEAQALITWMNQFSGGIGARAQGVGADASYLMLGLYPLQILNVKTKTDQMLRVGMSYDFTLQSLRLSSRNTYEIQVNYCIRLGGIGIHTEPHIDHPREIAPHPLLRDGNVPYF